MMRQRYPADVRRVVSARQRAHSMRTIYRILWSAWGPQGWWPARSRFEVMVGALLTQHTAWRNVERAMAQLRQHGVLTPQRLYRVSEARVAAYVRSAGTHRVKARRLRVLLTWLHTRWQCNLQRLFQRPTPLVRSELLQLEGIGPETADAILLYAGSHAVFVIDAYTRRIFERHGLVAAKTSYAALQHMVQQAMRGTAQQYNEYHALLTRLGKTYCRTVPQCDRCPLFTQPRMRGVWPIQQGRNQRQKSHAAAVHSAKSV